MESEQSGSLTPQLVEAQEALKEMLEEACSAEIYSADTGQLIRIQKVLALADEAAKEVISIRRKGRRASDGATAADDVQAEHAPVPHADAAPSGHRVFEDARGVRWDACAIHPSAPVGRVQLPEPYRTGWLFFESATQKRRLSPIPDGWQEASEDLLRGMCERAEVVPERASSASRRRRE
jgi:hypothetical protein